MNFTRELIVLSIVIVLLFIRPNVLVKFSKSTIGKVVFVSIIILSSSMNPLIGLFVATLMILLLETNYEGFKEGLDIVDSNNIHPPITTFGETDSNVNKIILARWWKAQDDISVNQIDLSGSNLAPLTLITEKLDTNSIIIDANYSISSGDISFVSVDNTVINYNSAPNVLPQEYDITFDSNIQSTKAIITESTAGSKIVDIVRTGQYSSPFNYIINSYDSSLVDSNNKPTATIEIITSDYSKNLIHNSHDGTNSYLTFGVGNNTITTNDYIVESDETTVYKVLDVSNTFQATLGTSIMNNIPHNTELEITDHNHQFSAPHTHESFISFNRSEETISDIKPYLKPENTFLSDLTGESVCSTNLCDRIDAESKIIFPVFSNNHSPTNI